MAPYRWDTAGAERFKGVTTTYFRGANGMSTTHQITYTCIYQCKVKHWVVCI